MAQTGHPFFHLHPSASRQIHPDIILPRPGGVSFAASEREAESISISKKLTKLASQEKSPII